MERWIKHRIEELFIILLILLNITDFLEILPGDFDFLKKILSWVCLGYLLYHASLTKLFFGSENKFLDITLILNYFIFIIKNIIHFAMVARHEVSFFHGLFTFLATHATTIEKFSFIVGGVLLLVHAIYITLKVHVHVPSLMHVIHEEGMPKSLYKKLERFFITFIVLVAFFVIVFNLIMEWLAIAVDAALGVLLLVFFGLRFLYLYLKRSNLKHNLKIFSYFIPVFLILFFVIDYIGKYLDQFLLVITLIFSFIVINERRSKDSRLDKIIFNIGSTAEHFYSKFIELFHQPHRILLGFSGLLVLHLLTDIGNFIVPYLFGFRDVIYLELLGEHTHQYLFELFREDMFYAGNLLNQISVIWVYILNVIGVIMLLFSPSYIWYKLYHRKGFKMNPIILSLFFCSVIVFFLAPTFKIAPISTDIVLGSGLVGVDLMTSNIVKSIEIPIVMVLSIIVSLFIYALSMYPLVKHILEGTAIVIVNIFTGYYIYYFVKTLLIYYLYPNIYGLYNHGGYLFYLINSEQYFIGLILALFLVFTILFYVGGFLIFLKETKKEYRYIR